MGRRLALDAAMRAKLRQFVERHRKRPGGVTAEMCVRVLKLPIHPRSAQRYINRFCGVKSKLRVAKTGGSSVQDAAVRLQWGRKSRKIKWGTIDLHLDAKFFKLPLSSTGGKLRSLRVWVKNGELLRTWAVKGSKGMKAPGVDLLQ
jgi:hypothetical protein